MTRNIYLLSAAVLIIHLSVPLHAGPFEGKTFKGRIAYSSDGNHNDEDDWAASPMVLAIFAAAGVRISWSTSTTTRSFPRPTRSGRRSMQKACWARQNIMAIRRLSFTTAAKI
jgi:hypothetical protein